MKAFLGVMLTLMCPLPVAAAPLGATPLEPGLAGRKDIIFFENFESTTWYKNWKSTSLPSNCSLYSSGFKGKALKVAVPKGQHYGTSFGFNFAKFALAEPESLYFRYYLRFDSSWDGYKGGKLPGFGGTYGVAGWGGKPSHGDDGWSARGHFSSGGSGKTWIGYYVYHVDMTYSYGDSWDWQKNNLGLLTHGKWYCVEGYVKLDSPAAKDGVLRGWVDGQLAFEKTNLDFRTVSKLKIERFWFDIYYGGSWTAAKDMSLYADNIVLASSRVGCYTAPTPDAGPPTPDAGTPTPDAGPPAPDAVTPVPDAGTPTPDSAGATDAAGQHEASGGDTSMPRRDALARAEVGADASPPNTLLGGDGCSCALGSAPARMELPRRFAPLVLLALFVMLLRRRRR